MISAMKVQRVGRLMLTVLVFAGMFVASFYAASQLRALTF